MSTETENKQSFIRILGRLDVLALAFGAIVGWGWVLLSGTWITMAGSLGATIAFIIGGAVIALISLTYAELASAMPNVGGEHVYTGRALGKSWSFVCSWALLFSYVGICSFEAVALPTAVEFLLPEIRIGTLWQFLGSDVDMGFVAIGVIGTALIGLVNYRGIKTAAIFQTLAVGMLIFVGLMLILGAFSFGSIDNSQPWILSPATGILGVLIMVPGLTFGFDVIAQSADEIDLPFQQIGKLLFFSVGLGVLWYVLIILGVSMSMPSADLATSAIASGDAATVLWGSKLAGQLLVLGGIAGILTSWNAFLVGGTRLLYALAKSGQLPAVFARLHPKYRTPYMAIIFVSAICMIAPFWGRTVLVWIINTASFTVVIAFLFVAISFVALRRNEPEMERPFKVRYGKIIGYSAIVLSLLLIAVYLPWSPASLIWPYEWMLLVAWAVLGGVLYVVNRGN